MINGLQANWVWAPNWIDSSDSNTAGRVVKFSREFTLPLRPDSAILHLSADTRYKLLVNGTRVAIGPARSSSAIWYYDTIDIAPYLRGGHNNLVILVLRYFAISRAALPFERTSTPGLTVLGSVGVDNQVVRLDSGQDWTVEVDNGLTFPKGLVDDVFLHVSILRSLVSRLESLFSKVLYSLQLDQ